MAEQIADSLNSAIVTGTTLSCRVASITRLGKLQTNPHYYYHALGVYAENLKLGAGAIHSLIINNVVNGAVITLSDSTTGLTPTIISHTAGATKTDPTPINMYGTPFSNGLRITVSGSNASVTVIYE